MTMTTMTTRTTTREAVNQTGQSLGNDMADLVIGILRADKGSYMSRLPLQFADNDWMGGGGGGGGVGNMMGSACSMTTATTTNMTRTTNTVTTTFMMMQRMGKGCAGERMMEGIRLRRL
jgi:hypothetical protein